MESETENSFADNIVDGFKTWLSFFVAGVWSLILFGILGFLIFAYTAFNHIKTLERNQEIRASSIENTSNKGQNKHARH